jgi:outer membrane protein, multidrug efflux system
MNLKVVAALLVASFGWGCASVQPLTSPSDVVAVPDAFTLYPASEAAPATGWDAFGNVELQALIAEALTNGLTVADAQARLDAALLRVRQAGAALYPSIDLQSGAGMTRANSDSGINAGRTVTTENYSLGLAAGFELDLWGRVRAERRAILRDADAGRGDLAAAHITVAATVSQAWVDLVAARATYALLSGQLETNRRILNLVEMRQRRGLTTAVAVYRQRQALAGIEALLPPMEAGIAALEHALSILIGRVPGGASPAVARRLPPLPAALPAVGLPAEILARRPDVRAAGARLTAAAERVEAARGARLPMLRLSAAGGFAAGAADTLFDHWLSNLAANLAGPIFDAGLRKAEVARSDALRRQQLAAYKRVVLTAIGEVETALARESNQRKHLAALDRQLAAARTALREQDARYSRGRDSYLLVLEQQAAVEQLERAAIAAQADLLRYRIALYRAIAGDLDVPDGSPAGIADGG